MRLLPVLRRSWRIDGQGEPASVGTWRARVPWACGGAARAGAVAADSATARAASTTPLTCFTTEGSLTRELRLVRVLEVGQRGQHAPVRGRLRGQLELHEDARDVLLHGCPR